MGVINSSARTRRRERYEREWRLWSPVWKTAVCLCVGGLIGLLVVVATSMAR